MTLAYLHISNCSSLSLVANILTTYTYQTVHPWVPYEWPWPTNTYLCVLEFGFHDLDLFTHIKLCVLEFGFHDLDYLHISNCASLSSVSMTSLSALMVSTSSIIFRRSCTHLLFCDPLMEAPDGKDFSISPCTQNNNLFNLLMLYISDNISVIYVMAHTLYKCMGLKVWLLSAALAIDI